MRWLGPTRPGAADELAGPHEPTRASTQGVAFGRADFDFGENARNMEWDAKERAKLAAGNKGGISNEAQAQRINDIIS